HQIKQKAQSKDWAFLHLSFYGKSYRIMAPTRFIFGLYPSYFKSLMCWLRITRPIHGPRPDGLSHATFKSAPGRFVAHPSHIVIYAPGDSLPCRL
ncbi:TPA_asm: hypothetical protein G0D12_25440, partial [Salmonella enterica subsp. enterica serovar Eastbourne]|nr:hypothetical protein [Salmonella enterica subsp. enterica serovar Eastbourne]